MFIVGTEADHVAPWRSVYKFHLLTEAEITFVLTSGGHNAGIVSEPGHPRRHYRIAMQAADGRYVDPDLWVADAALKEGSWWPAWTAWLAARSGAPAAPPSIGRAEGGLPGDLRRAGNLRPSQVTSRATRSDAAHDRKVAVAGSGGRGPARSRRRGRLRQNGALPARARPVESP